MEEPDRECSFQCSWDEDEEAWNCQFIEMSQGEHFCDKTICPFWKEQRIAIEQVSKEIKEAKEEDFK